jgi:hypothetical protein
MTPIDPLAASLCAAGGLLLGWWLRGRVGAREASSATATQAHSRPLAQVEVTLLQHSVCTNVVVQRDQLDELAHGIGYYLAPLPTQQLQ